MLELHYYTDKLEAGCDEAGRGCLAGPVFAAAVILPPDFSNELLNDSKQLSEKQRKALRIIIESEALAWAVARVEHDEIDKINILNASIAAMHRALDKLTIAPQHILVDGNRFKPYKEIEHHCIIKGDGKYMAIAAASVLAKTHRDEHMLELHQDYPHYDWASNKGYPTRFHREQLKLHGISPFHRKSFNLTNRQLSLDFDYPSENTGGILNGKP